MPAFSRKSACDVLSWLVVVSWWFVLPFPPASSTLMPVCWLAGMYIMKSVSASLAKALMNER